MPAGQGIAWRHITGYLGGYDQADASLAQGRKRDRAFGPVGFIGQSFFPRSDNVNG
jgi:hypothetical protein